MTKRVRCFRTVLGEFAAVNGGFYKLSAGEPWDDTEPVRVCFLAYKRKTYLDQFGPEVPLDSLGDESVRRLAKLV